MQKLSSTIIVSLFGTLLALAQNPQQSEGRRFLKRIETNYRNNITISLPDGRKEGYYNVDSKKGVEKLFFGDFNAKIEYFFAPSFEGASGIRIYRDSQNKSYLLEVKTISNFRQVDSILAQEYPFREIPDNLTQDSLTAIDQYNREIITKKNEERANRYRLNDKIIPVNDMFVNKLHDHVADVIKNYKSAGNLAMYTDGDWVTFRTVVDYDVWSLNIQAPDGELKTLSDLFRQMIADVEAGTFDEAKYIPPLNH